MTPKIKKIIIIAVPIAIAIIVIILATLYFTTDFLKSDKTLFLKYMSQNIDAAKIVMDNKSEKEFTNILKQNKYESSSEINTTYTEKINTSEENKKNDINKIKVNIDSQSEYLNNYCYKDISIMYNDSNLLRTEYIHDGEKYGLRFPQQFNQFLIAKNQNLKEVADKAGLSEEQISLIPDSIQEYDYNTALSFTDEELETLKNKYLDIIKENIPKKSYAKQKNAMITIENESITTTAYSLTLTQEQANELYIKILENLKSDEIIINKLSQLSPLSTIFNLIKQNEDAYNTKFLEERYVSIIEDKIEEIRQNNIGTSEVRCTVYQINGNTIRTQITQEASEFTIDFNDLSDDNIKVNIQNSILNEEQEDKSTVTVTKNNSEAEKSFTVEAERILGGTVSNWKIYRNISLDESEVNATTGINYNDGNDNLLETTIEKEVTLNNDFEKSLELDEKNSVIVNDYEKELVSKWVTQVREYLNSVKSNNQTIINNIEKIELIRNLLDIQGEPVKAEENVTSDVEKNRFNAKFEFYTGKEKKTEELTKLLEEVKNDIKSAQVSYSNEGSSEGTKKLESIKLEVENAANKPELADSVKEMLEQSKSYKVEIEKNSNDIVTTVTITINK